MKRRMKAWEMLAFVNRGSNFREMANLTLDVASKHSIDTGAGVIDADYRGPVMVLLYNFSDEDFTGTHLLAGPPAPFPPIIPYRRHPTRSAAIDRNTWYTY
jgi:hypothetical protein